jgi:hypothetical protein
MLTVEDGTVSLLEMFAAVLLVIGSVLVMWAVVRADATYERRGDPEVEALPSEHSLRRAA